MLAEGQFFEWRNRKNWFQMRHWPGIRAGTGSVDKRCPCELLFDRRDVVKHAINKVIIIKKRIIVAVSQINPV